MFEESVIKAFVVMFAAVAILGGLLYLLKRFAAKNNLNKNVPGIKVLSKVPLQSKASLFVIKVGDKTLLVGVSDRSISTLADLSEETDSKSTAREELKKIKPSDLRKMQSSRPAPTGTDRNPLSFKSFLKSSFKRYN